MKYLIPILFLSVSLSAQVYNPPAGGSSSGTVPSGALADYTFTEASGTSLVDHSGNGNNGTLGTSTQAPTWSSTGLTFARANNVSLPASVNSFKTIFLAVYINPITSGPQTTNDFPVMISSSGGGTGFNLEYIATATNGQVTFGFAPSMYVNSGTQTAACVMLSGFHVFGIVLGTGGGNLDHVYIDGVESPCYIGQGANAGKQTSGNLYFGTSNVSPWTSSGFIGTFYRAVMYTAQLTATQIQNASGSIRNDIANRGVNVTPVPVLQTIPYFHAIGDSITYGQGISNAWPTIMTLTNQPAYTIRNWGISGLTAQAVGGSETNRVGTLCQSTSGPNIAVVMLGTNDLVNSLTSPTIAGFLSGETEVLRLAGCRVFLGTMISRSGLDSGKNALDPYILNQAQSLGASGVIDFAADPLLGADGAYANATYFQDGVHPTQAGQQIMADEASRVLNYYFGSQVNPTVVTANTYQILSSDAVITAAPTGNATYTMPNCNGPSGVVYIINNPQSAFSLTIQGGASQPINGASAITIPNSSTARLQDVPNPKTTAGCHWAM